MSLKQKMPTFPDDEASKSPDALYFSVDAALLFQLGEELVNRRSVALGELIKNAYDADATKVTLTFRNTREVGGSITIADNGIGMTLDGVRSSWMRIATTEKVDGPLSRLYKRPKAGAKGIGRFAARRLARTLDIVSTALLATAPVRGTCERTHVIFHWDDFSPGKLVSSIPVAFDAQTLLPVTSDHDTGLTLNLQNLRDAWSIDDIRALQNDLLQLMSSTTEADTVQGRDPGFKITLVAPEFPELTGDLAERFLDHGLGVLKGELDENGIPSFSLKFRGKKILKFLPPTSRFPVVGPASFVIHLFVYKREFFSSLPISTREAQTRGRERGGVHIYVDRFRVPPYGDPHDDWLGVDEDRGRRLDATPKELIGLASDVARPMLSLPGNNQLFGSVQLSRLTNTAFHQTSNRERFIENDAFEELKKFVRLGVNWMTVMYAREYILPRDKQGPKDEPVSLLLQARERFVAASANMSQEDRVQVLQAIDLATSAIHLHQEDLISELSMLRVLASTGTMIVIFDHQLMGALSALRESNENLARQMKQLGARARESVKGELNRLTRWIDDIAHQAELIGLLVSRDARARRRRLALRPIVQSMADAFTAYMRDMGVSFENDVPLAAKTPPMFTAELSAILVNLITNALKAVRATPERRIRAYAIRGREGLRIEISDTGIGADSEHWEEYFLPFKGESEPDPMLGHGTGLGLKIVRDLVSPYGGEACFVEPQPPWRTTVVVTIPEV